MPKIIEELRENILKEAKKQVFNMGYSNMTIRSVAAGCGIAVGTIYNYFPSKDSMIVAFMLEDWIPLLVRLKDVSLNVTDCEEAVSTVYCELLGFNKEYQSLFSEQAAIVMAGEVYRKRHKELRFEITHLIQTIIKNNSKSASPFFCEFLAEALLTWSSELHDYNDLKTVIKPLLMDCGSNMKW